MSLFLFNSFWMSCVLWIAVFIICAIFSCLSETRLTSRTVCEILHVQMHDLWNYCWSLRHWKFSSIWILLWQLAIGIASLGFLWTVFWVAAIKILLSRNPVIMFYVRSDVLVMAKGQIVVLRELFGKLAEILRECPGQYYRWVERLHFSLFRPPLFLSSSDWEFHLHLNVGTMVIGGVRHRV